MTNPITQDLGGVVLLPCPWCGKKPNIGQWGAQDLTAWPDATAIECSSDLHDCPVNPSVTGYTRAEAIAAWNTRTHSAEIAGALRDAERWQPIESAPRDGRAVILAHLGGKPYIGKWCHDTWVDERGLSHGPSHWRPLPAPPTQDSAMQQGGGGGE